MKNYTFSSTSNNNLLASDDLSNTQILDSSSGQVIYVLRDPLANDHGLKVKAKELAQQVGPDSFTVCIDRVSSKATTSANDQQDFEEVEVARVEKHSLKSDMITFSRIELEGKELVCKDFQWTISQPK